MSDLHFDTFIVFSKFRVEFMRFPVISVTTVVLSDREFEVKTVLLLVFLIETILVEYSHGWSSLLGNLWFQGEGVFGTPIHIQCIL